MLQKVIIVGGGAAGFFAAIHNKQNHPECSVTILEKSNEVLAKVKISGGGRCNVTHACFGPRILVGNYPRGGKELLGPFHRFQPKDTMDWFISHGVPLKIEADNRVFPVSDDSQSILDCLINTAKKLGISIWTQCLVTQIVHDSSGFCLSLANGEKQVCQKLILATGSSRAGYEFAKSLGHTIEPPIPSLFTLTIHDKLLHSLSGLSVSETKVWITGEEKQAQTGPLLVTHWGMSGPSIIKLSAWNAQALHQANYRAELRVDWLPRLDLASKKRTLDQFQKQNFQKSITKQSPFSTIPHRLWNYLVGKAIGLEATWKTLNEKSMATLCQELDQGAFQVVGKGIFKDEFVTCGGITLKEINFKTMESKRCPGLHLVGELLHIDGITGGFNFQNAWTTGFISQ